MDHPPKDVRRNVRQRSSLLLVAIAALAATPFVARLSPLRMGERVVDAPGEIADVSTEAAAEVAQIAHVTAAARAVAGTGRHLGFDTYAYPGDRAMRAWRTSKANYEWTGFYLPSAPCHDGTTWAGKRDRLIGMGYGIAVIYVGQQTWGDRKPLSPAKVQRAKANGATCLAAYVSGPRGRMEADDAIARTAREGFPPGTVIYLDVERMDIVPPRMREYYRQWAARVLEDGRYVPGVYVHTYNAKLVYKDMKAVYATAGIDADPPFWVAGGSGFRRDKAPTDVGHTFAHAWQGILDVVETRNGVRLPIDVNVAAVRSPSGMVALGE